MNRLLAAVLLGAPTATLAALGPRYGGDLTVAVLGLPASTDPQSPRGSSDVLVAGLVHETLVAVGADGLPAPSLARGWSTAASGREWTLELPVGAAFHDDRPITSDDAVRSLRRFLRSSSPAAAQLAEALEGGTAFAARSTEMLTGLAAPDPQRLVLRLGEARALPLAPLAAFAAAVTSPAGAGCGPFVPTLSVPGRRMGLTAFGGHARGRPYLDAIQMVPFADPTALRADLRAGRVDLGPGEGGPQALAATLLLVLDPSLPPFDRPDARRAVAGAIDRIDLAGRFLLGAEPSRGLLAPVLLPPRSDGAPAAPEARLGGTVTMTVSREVPPLVSQRVVAYLGAIGLSVTVSAAQPAAALSASSPARLLFWTPEVAEAGLALNELATLAHPDPLVREALAAALRESDLDRRRALLYRAESALRTGHALVPLAAAPVWFTTRRGVHGARVTASGRLVLEDAWVEP